MQWFHESIQDREERYRRSKMWCSSSKNTKKESAESEIQAYTALKIPLIDAF